MTSPLDLQSGSTALVIVDIQNFTLGHDTHPHTALKIKANNERLVSECRKRGVAVIFVRIAGIPHMGLNSPADAPFGGFTFAPDWQEFHSDLAPHQDETVITKHNWGAFYGTELDSRLRRNGIRTVLITGIATNFGVESTARQAHEAAYHCVLVEDAMGAYSVEDHRFAIERIFPRLGRVRSTDQVIAALQSL